LAREAARCSTIFRQEQRIFNSEMRVFGVFVQDAWELKQGNMAVAISKQLYMFDGRTNSMNANNRTSRQQNAIVSKYRGYNYTPVDLNTTHL